MRRIALTLLFLSIAPAPAMSPAAYGEKPSGPAVRSQSIRPAPRRRGAARRIGLIASLFALPWSAFAFIHGPPRSKPAHREPPAPTTAEKVPMVVTPAPAGVSSPASVPAPAAVSSPASVPAPAKKE